MACLRSIRRLVIQIQLSILLRLPVLYWHRLDLAVSRAQTAANSAQLTDLTPKDFSEAWNRFIEELSREWATLNVVSALLLSALFAIFGLDTNTYTRTFAMLAFVCSLMVLLYGCTYIIRFGSIKPEGTLRIWVKEMRDKDDSLKMYLWNGGHIMAMPAIWLAWSILFFIVSFFFFVWGPKRSQSEIDDMHNFALGSRISGVEWEKEVHHNSGGRNIRRR
ncbi:hypothetical protein BDN72DRAFT_898644 [Pluteus cervinus]|uniref:Uncharacterized protein n=1 Tax=Pluteus cervinus TaxID=181527 RepID=A0ACD3AQ21_9AGAR|nr:hypothetical protein BDN72DRAFT_898644 [Pluteus cervinus]